MLRWAPVDPPVLVPRAAYTAGESLRHLVIRSEVTVANDPGQGDTLTVQPAPETCERHVAPPKSSQLECELIGCFDDAMSPDATPDERLKAMLAARREAGTFLDTEIPRLDGPGQEPVAGIRLEDPTHPTDPADLKTLPLNRGDALAPGQYVVHDADEVALPYLPDPLARGVSFGFPDAGHDRPLSGAMAAEGTTADYVDLDEWPAVAPFRLVLQGGETLGAAVERRTIDLTLPPSDTLRVRMASSIDRARLDLLGVWRSLPSSMRQDPMLAEAAADGSLWALSPSEDVVFVHAVSRPLQAPRPTLLEADRDDSDTGTWLHGGLDLHGPSTESVVVEAIWTQQEDDITQNGPEVRQLNAVACTFPLQPHEDIALLAREDDEAELPDSTLVFHRCRQEFGDTRHRVVDYRFRANTRFREYFPVPADPADRTVVGPARRISVPSAARPPKPAIRQVLPMFQWEQDTEPEQPFALRRRRRSGVRIYLDRPWFSSGDDELLGVIVGQIPDLAIADLNTSRWGSDPIWHGRGPDTSTLGVELDQLHMFKGADDPDQPALPVRRSGSLPLVDLPHEYGVHVLGYRPEYDADRQLWFADIAVDPGGVTWPFLRLAVARYQPHSLPRTHLSPVVRCDYVQLPLERTATLSRPDDRVARIVVSGPVTYRSASLAALFGSGGLEALRPAVGQTRRMEARLEKRVTSIGTDLGWETVAEMELPIEGYEPETLTAAWVGQFEFPEAAALNRPDGSGDWRVSVIESEILQADYLPGEMHIADRPTYQARVVYVDQLEL